MKEDLNRWILISSGYGFVVVYTLHKQTPFTLYEYVQMYEFCCFYFHHYLTLFILCKFAIRVHPNYLLIWSFVMGFAQNEKSANYYSKKLVIWGAQWTLIAFKNYWQFGIDVV